MLEGMKQARVAVIDDEPRIRSLLEIELGRVGFNVRGASDGATGFELIREWGPDLVLLDVMMPHIDGISLLPLLRRLTQAPIVILSAKGTVADKAVGLRNGADFYLSKPFEMTELVSLLQAALRRPVLGSVEFLSFHNLTMNVRERSVERANKRIHLSGREFELLATLMREPRRIFSREQLLERVWGDREVTLGIIDTYMSSLRAKVDRPFDELLIHNVRGAGYGLRRRGD